MNLLHINKFNPARWIKPDDGSPYWSYDWYVRDQLEGTLDEFYANLVPIFEDTKEKTPLFNLTRTKLPAAWGQVKRNDKDKFSGVSALVLDIDGSMTVDEFCQLYDGTINAVLYTTHSHRSERKGGKDCFRVIVEITEDIPWDLLLKPSYDNESILPALFDLFPMVDASCFEPQRGHFFFSCKPGAPHEKRRLHGEALDWRQLPVTPRLIKVERAPQQTKRGGSGAILQHTLDFLQLFEDRGWVRQRRGDVLIVQCPNELEHSSKDDGTRIILGGGNARFKCHHSHCGGTSWLVTHLFSTEDQESLRPYCEARDDSLLLVKKETDAEDEEFEQHTLSQFIKEREFTYPSDRLECQQTVQAFTRAFLKSTKQHAILKTPEGYGKSTSIVREANNLGWSIMFCCSSNAQAKEKQEAFSKAGYDVHRAVSMSALFEEKLGQDGVKLEFLPKDREGSAWQQTQVDRAATIANIFETFKCTKDEAEQIYEDIETEAKNSKNLEDKTFVVTTFDLGSILCQNGHWLVIADDPNSSNFIRFKFEDISGKPKMVKKKVKKEISWEPDVRAKEDLIFANVPFPSKVIWTTTEQLTRDLILANHDCILRDIEESIDTGYDVMVVPTRLCNKNLRDILTGIDQIVRKSTGHEYSFIAEGVKSDLNFTNTKGRNDLINDQVIIRSCPNLTLIAEITASMDLTLDQQAMVSGMYVVDELNQALGRCQGYRKAEFEQHKSLIVCHPRVLRAITSRCRYRVRTFDMMKKTGKYSHIPEIQEWYEEVPEYWFAFIEHIARWKTYITERTLNGVKRYFFEPTGHFLSEEAKKQVVRELNRIMTPVEWFFKDIEMPIESDGRRQYFLTLKEAVKKQVVTPTGDQRKTQVTNNKRKTKKLISQNKVGKKKYQDPITGECKMFTPGQEPNGWTLKSKR